MDSGAEREGKKERGALRAVTRDGDGGVRQVCRPGTGTATATGTGTRYSTRQQPKDPRLLKRASESVL